MDTVLSRPGADTSTTAAAQGAQAPGAIPGGTAHSADHRVQSEAATHRALRFLTAGSVDDGKSTLIGRLLFDSRAVLADQLDMLERRAAGMPLDLSLLTDGLEAERELCWPPAEFAEGESEFVLSVGLPGFEPQEIEATLTPREVIVHSHHGSERKGKRRGRVAPSWSELRSDDLYRRIELPDDIDVAHARAALRHGMLRIILPKLATLRPVIPVARAA